jgi:hypothetical protein
MASGYTTGWFDTSIHDFLISLHEVPPSMVGSLITVLDSSTEPSSLLETSPHLRGIRPMIHVVGKGLYVSTRELLKAERKNRIFFGFDEIWFFPGPRLNNEPLTQRPDHLSIVGPRGIDSNLISELQDWMRSTHCSLGLGDGEGVNFCARLSGFAGVVLDAFAQSEARSRNVG